ncbi:MAG: hypothetical protein JJE04_23855 [Acidobacteriia bacterium]|nr:hypothetical protein [Terriglobia bacterium]
MVWRVRRCRIERWNPRVKAGAGHFDLPELDAMESPGIAEELLEKSVFERAFRADLSDETGLELSEIVFLAVQAAQSGAC